MAYTCASEDYTTLQAKADGRASRVAAQRSYRVPAGMVHAVEPGIAEAECGLPLDGLHRWPDLPWEEGTYKRCGHCLRAVPIPGAQIPEAAADTAAE
jgi:hypothetical protein